MGGSSFINITYLCVSDCRNCFSLPPFGELPSLKELSIKGMTSVHSVGREFHCGKEKSSSFQPFPSLEILTFKTMPIWEEWILFEGEGSKCPFPQLKRLSLDDCPILRGDIPNNLPSLKEFSISNCTQLEAKSTTLHWIMSVEELNIEQVEEGLLRALDHFPLDSLNMKSLTIEKCDSLQSLPGMIMAGHCLQRLTLEDIPSIVSFPIDGLPTSLQDLQIRKCEKLEFLPQDAWKTYTSLESLRIWDSCPSLKSFPLGCFPKLKSLWLDGCDNLESFTHVGGSALPLEAFYVQRCKELRSMSEVHIDSLPNLQHFTLNLLRKLESLPQGGLPSNLRSLTLGGCNSIPIQDWGFQHLTSLSYLSVKNDGSESILHYLLKNQLLLPTSLVCIRISRVSNLKVLEGKGLQHLASLEELHILGCRNLECLPEDELPSSLLLLKIISCPKLEERYDYERGKQHLSKISHIPTILINNQLYDP